MAIAADMSSIVGDDSTFRSAQGVSRTDAHLAKEILVTGARSAYRHAANAAAIFPG